MVNVRRLYDFDFIKGVLILFVIWGHCCMYLSGNEYEKNIIITYVRLFQMPLFILISGYFQKPVEGLKSLSSKIKTSFKCICVPLISWTFTGHDSRLSTFTVMPSSLPDSHIASRGRRYRWTCFQHVTLLYQRSKGFCPELRCASFCL